MPPSRGKAFPRSDLRPATQTVRVADLGELRGFLEADPVGNAVVWDRVFQHEGTEVYVDGRPPRGLIAIRRAGRAGGANFVALHALDADAAGALGERVPAGFAIVHLTEEFPLPLLEPRAAEFHPHPAWLFQLSPNDLVAHPDPRVRALEPRWAERIGTLWRPDWPAERYVRSRIEAGPTAAIYEDGDPVAWALTHLVTDRVGLIGMVHVLDEFRRKGLARAVVSAISRELMRLGRTPALHAFVDNTASLALFPTLGFRKVRRQVWGDAVFR